MIGDIVKGVLEWLTELIEDVATGKKTTEQARAEAQAKGFLITETDSAAELAEYDKATGSSDR